ncbi:MAG: FAD-binding oxidoreductase [Leptolyngbya sp. DLM2.Bin15]|nr:MAG: FAD-binding oxidoreductase [Leptolyngbya sp. DLM2.Bin15]
MTTYDWIVIGNGITGAALSYELAHVGFSVLLLDQRDRPPSATRFSYGGVAFWAGTTDATQRLCQEGIDRHRQLSDELGVSTEFHERDLLMPVFPDDDLPALTHVYQRFHPQPTLIDRQTACELEPLLNPEAIAAAFVVKHGHVHPEKTAQAYNYAFQRLGGQMAIAPVQEIQTHQGKVTGVVTPTETYAGNQVVVCAGGMSRALLHPMQISVPCYFSHAELIETPPVDFTLRTVIMPANTRRFALEATVEQNQHENLWDEAGHEIAPPILDAGVFQFADGHLRLGQISRLLTDPHAPVDAAASERQIRAAIAHLIPALDGVPGQWHRCLVAFSGDRMPLVGALPERMGLHLFSGFSNPFAFIPPLAQRFAKSQAGEADPLIESLAPSRFKEQD